MYKSHTVRLPLADTELDVVFHTPSQPRAWVVCLHGLESDKDGRKYFMLADRITPHGIGVVRFDFRGCGKSGGRFEETNVGTRVADARAVLEATHKQAGGKRLGLFGSSMGGFVALFLSTDPGVEATVTLAAPANLDDLVDGDQQQASHLAAFVAEHRAGEYRKLPPAIPNLLLMHGSNDEVVPPAHARIIGQHQVDPAGYRMFPGGDHRFSDPDQLDEAMQDAVDWFTARLLRE